MRNFKNWLLVPVSSTFLALALVLSSSVAFGAGKVRTVNCTGVGTDRAAIQAVINSAQKDDTIKLVGTCQMDGPDIKVNKSNLTIQGVGNHATKIRGITATDGTVSANAFLLGDDSGSAKIKNVTFQNLTFESLNRAIYMAPQLGNTASGKCEDLYLAWNVNHSGYASHITVTNNVFNKVVKGIYAFGTGDHIVYSNNVATNIGTGRVFLLEGLCTLCKDSVPPSGLPIVVPPDLVDFTKLLGPIVDSAIIGNKVTQGTITLQTGGGGLEGNGVGESITVEGTERVLVADNVVNIGAVGQFAMFIATNKNTLVINNKMSGGPPAFEGGGILTADFFIHTIPGYPAHSKNVLMVGNTMSNLTGGILVGTDTTERFIAFNNFINMELGAVYLCGDQTDPFSGIFCGTGESNPLKASFGNTVIAKQSDAVIDNGVNNKIIRVGQ